MSKDKKLLFSTAIIAIASLLTRILGLLRSTLLSSIYGATSSRGYADIYIASFVIPDIIFNVIVLGTISIILVPYLSKYFEDQEKINQKCSEIVNLFFLAILIVNIIIFIFVPQIVKNFLVKGWQNDSEKIYLTIKLTRIMLLQPLFLTLSSIFQSYLNVKEKYISYSISLLMYNIGIIIGILFLRIPLGLSGLAWGTVLGSFAMFFIQFVGSLLGGYRYSFVFPEFTKDFIDMLKTAIPRIIAIGGEQLVKFFYNYFGSFLVIGAISIYSYAENFSFVPYSMIPLSLSVTLFPIFSKLYNQSNIKEMLKILLEKLEIVLYLIFPFTVLMSILNYDIINLLLGYKNFNNNDIIITGKTLSLYMIGMPFYSITIIAVKYLYAQKKTFSPMVVSLISIFITIITCYILLKTTSNSKGVEILSIARSTGYIIQAILLMILILKDAKNIENQSQKTFFINTIKISIINIVIYFILNLTYNSIFQSIFQNQFFNSKILSIIKGISISTFFIILYILLTYISKLPQFEVYTKICRKIVKLIKK